jgi:hypothetical protein
MKKEKKDFVPLSDNEITKCCSTSLSLKKKTLRPNSTFLTRCALSEIRSKRLDGRPLIYQSI